MFERICVLGNTLEQAIQLLDILCQANKDSIYRRRRDVAIMNDGTELIAMSIQDEFGFVGRSFDYIFYEKNRFGSYCRNYGIMIERIQQCCLSHSTIPSEFRWCAVDTSIT